MKNEGENEVEKEVEVFEVELPALPNFSVSFSTSISPFLHFIASHSSSLSSLATTSSLLRSAHKVVALLKVEKEGEKRGGERGVSVAVSSHGELMCVCVCIYM